MTSHEPPRERKPAPPNVAIERRKERGASSGGAAVGPQETREAEGATAAEAPEEHREEVAGQGSGETAGGSPATAAGEHTSAQRSAPDAELDFDPAVLRGGGDPSNTPPQNPALGGEDYLTVNFYVEYDAFDSTRQRLNKAQEEAKNGTNRNRIQLGDIAGVVARGGVPLGAGEKALYAPWKIETDHGVTLIVCDRDKPHETQPSLQLRATSLPLMRLGFPTVLSVMRYLIACLGGVEVRNKLSRVDPCIDLAGLDFATLGDAFSRGHFVTRAKKSRRDGFGLAINEHTSGTRFTSFSIGKSPLMLRVYDKLEEARRDPLKLDVMTVMRWGDLPESATRVEFQLSRERLKRLGVDTVEDWIRLRSDIIGYLTTKWFRLTEGPVDRRRPERTRTHPRWRIVQDTFQQAYGVPFGLSLSPLPSLAVDPSAHAAQAVGVLMTALVLEGERVETNEEFLRHVVRLVHASIADRDMAEEVARRAVEKRVGGLGL